ncbi:hypothetical protein LTR62_000685 [Meristemomyces frigidus]|uniref:RlpA-like protein double-psi beta-barrel domain-containing protein n=1 Tax=Meristemomyces frigidus TaxID=1508187 RepID=A0AAN7TA10_9PEZI|nr:hypothetical protein LTR62_000685 [Meristemomyces frigidus]
MLGAITRKPVPVHEKAVEDPIVNTPALDNGAHNFSAHSRSRGAGAKLDAVLPRHRRYGGMSRKVFLIALAAAILALLALIIGLAAGLSGHSTHGALPLPSNSETFTGDLTYYGTGLGACGETSGDSDDIVSVSHIIFDAAGSSSSTGGNSNNNPLCNKMLRASRYDEEFGQVRSVDLKVVDRCTGCQPDDLDTSLGAFEKLAPQASGRVGVTWAWLQPVQTGS